VRTQAIEDRLTELFRSSLDQTTVMVDRSTWDQMPLPPRFRYGYMPPVPVTTDNEDFVVSFCPELIDRVTAWLDDDGLDTYLNAVEAFVAGHLMLPEASADEVIILIENELHDKAPNALAFMTEVELQAMDDGIVPKL
jgi:hypothetical protein